jgi:hypothetical protein
MEKGDDIVDDDDDDAVRTSVSQVQVTEKLCSKELFLSTQYKLFSPLIRRIKMWGGGGYVWST